MTAARSDDPTARELAPLLDAYATAVRRATVKRMAGTEWVLRSMYEEAYADRDTARALVRALVAAWDHDRGAHALRCGGALVEAVGRCREAMEEWG